MLLLLALIDIRNKKIPVLPVVLMGAALLAVRLYKGTDVAGIVCSLIPGTLLFLLAVLSKEKIGRGDALVLLALGCGYGVWQVIGVLGLSLLLAAVVSAVLLIAKKAGRKTELPFVPFLFCGLVVYVCMG